MQHFLKDCFTRRILPFSCFFCGVNYSRLCSFRPMHTQFSINLTWLEIIWLCQKTVLLPPSNCGWSQIQATGNLEQSKRKIAHFLRFSQVQILKIVCRKKVLLVFKNVQNLFFTPKFLLSFFRLMSLVSHHAAFLERLFYKKNPALFLVFCGELFPIVFI